MTDQNSGSRPPGQPAPAPSQPPDGQSPYGQSPYGQSPYGQSSDGPTPVPGQPPYGQSPYGQSSYGPTPVPGQPAFGQPTFGQPTFGQPAYGQPPTGQPAFGSPPPYGQGQQPYGQQPYGQQPYGQQPGQPPFGPPNYQSPGASSYGPGYPGGPPAPAKSWIARFWPWIAGVVAVIVVLGVIGAVAGGDANPGSNHTLSAPEQSGSYVKQSGALADRVATSASTALDSQFSAADVLTGVYGTSASATPAFVFLGVHSSKLASRSADSSVSSFLSGADIPSATKVDAGPLGGVMKCGVSSTTQTTCVWVDHNTLGALVFVSTSADDAASVARAFRSDAEK